jgi:uncharacterized SAM-binding protein YcdF (DUF218 family)
LDSHIDRTQEGLPVRRPFSFSTARVRRWLLVPAAFVVLLIVVYLLRAPILTGLAKALVVSDPLQHADIIYVMGGDASSRPLYAAELYKRGLAPRVVIPRTEVTPAEKLGAMPNESDAAVHVMVTRGVPPEAITELSPPGGSTSTVDDARLLAEYAQQQHIQRAIVVTSAFHSRRTRWVIRHQRPPVPFRIMMAPVEDFGFDETNWWKAERGMLNYIQEYIKFVHNWWQG